MAQDVKIKAQVYKDPRPAAMFDRFHERVRDHPPEWVYELVRIVTVWMASCSSASRDSALRTRPTGL